MANESYIGRAYSPRYFEEHFGEPKEGQKEYEIELDTFPCDAVLTFRIYLDDEGKLEDYESIKIQDMTDGGSGYGEEVELSETDEGNIDFLLSKVFPAELTDEDSILEEDEPEEPLKPIVQPAPKVETPKAVNQEIENLKDYKAAFEHCQSKKIQRYFDRLISENNTAEIQEVKNTLHEYTDIVFKRYLSHEIFIPELYTAAKIVQLCNDMFSVYPRTNAICVNTCVSERVSWDYRLIPFPSLCAINSLGTYPWSVLGGIKGCFDKICQNNVELYVDVISPSQEFYSELKKEFPNLRIACFDWDHDEDFKDCGDYVLVNPKGLYDYCWQIIEEKRNS